MENSNKEQITVCITQKGYGIIGKIPMQDKRLNVISKAIYAYLCSFSGKGKSCYPTQAMMSADLGISRDTVIKYLKELTEFGYISKLQNREKGKYNKNIYIVSEKITLSDSAVSDLTVSDTAVSDVTVSDEVDTNNNIYNNNNINNNIINNNTTTNNHNNITVDLNRIGLNPNGGGGVIDYYKKHISENVSDIETAEIQKWLEKGFEEKVIEECINTAVRNNKKFLNYIIGILNRLERQNIKTYQEYTENENAYKEKKGGKNNGSKDDNSKQKIYGCVL